MERKRKGTRRRLLESIIRMKERETSLGISVERIAVCVCVCLCACICVCREIWKELNSGYRRKDGKREN